MKKIALLLLCFFSISTFAKEYPSVWWQPFPREQAESWEILPQDAKAGEVILSKRNELGLLSNFAATPFVLDGLHYASIEGFWQMLKYPEGKDDERHQPGIEWIHTREQVAQMTGFEAKAAGKLANENMKKLKIEWVTYRGQRMNYLENKKGSFYQLIRRAMSEKWQSHPEVEKLLAQTEGLQLRPDHHQEKTVAPAWRYHEIWMEIRDLIQPAF